MSNKKTKPSWFDRVIAFIWGDNLDESIEEPEKLIPWKQSKDKPVPERRVMPGQKETKAFKLLRDNELKNPAPFSHHTVINKNPGRIKEYEYPFDVASYSGEVEYINIKEDVPITKIIGTLSTGNYDVFKEGMTYREVLFACLHGMGVIMESLEFLRSDADKDENMPHEPVEGQSKSISRNPMEFEKYGEYYFTLGAGHQRAIMAMFWIWQNEGEHGVIKNVSVTEVRRNLLSDNSERGKKESVIR